MKPTYPITGTFIDDVTYDIPSMNWSKEQWIRELDYMQAVGIDTLITIRGGFYHRTNYPSKYFPSSKTEEDDLLGLLLEECSRRNMAVIVGMYISDLCWNAGDAQTEIEKNKLFVDEILERYGQYPALKGWYIPHEVGNNCLHITDVFKGLGSICKERTPGLPVMISPFFLPDPARKHENLYLDPTEMEAEWDEIFEQSGGVIDICAMQNNFIFNGNFDTFDPYFSGMKRACDRHGVSLWSNAETIDTDVKSTWYPIPFEILRKKIEYGAKYVDKFITFEFSHFMSPQGMFPSCGNLYNLYKSYYEKHQW